MKRHKKQKMPLKLLGRRAAELLSVVMGRGGRVPGWSVRRRAHHKKGR